MWLVGVVALSLGLGGYQGPDLSEISRPGQSCAVENRQNLPFAGKSAEMASFEAFAESSWRVQCRDGKKRPFALNVPQRIIDWEVDEAQRARRPVLVDILKARRQGISTYCCARMQHAVETVEGFQALSMADKAELPRQWIRRAKIWYSGQPRDARPPIANSTANELYFAGLGSRYFIGSAEGKTPGMGDGLAGLHVSEVENFLSPAKMFADLNPAIEYDNPRTLVFRESTGEMEGSYWHETVLASLKGGSGWKLVFLPWFISPEYARPTKLTPADYTAEERELVALARKWAVEHLEHAAIAGFEAIRPEQVEWRRFIIATFFAGDPIVFASRYPATIAEAFMSVGSLGLPGSIVRQHKLTARPPIERFTLVREISGKVVKVPCEADSGPHWQLFEPFDEWTEYALGADVAEGIVSDLSDDRSERDFSAIVAINRRTLTTAGLYHGRIEPDLFGKQLRMAGEFFNMAWLAPEVNSAGMATLAEVRTYPHLMLRDGSPDDPTPPEAQPMEKLGWKTTGTSRDLLIDSWVAACRPEPGHGFEGQIVCLIPELAREEGTFIRGKTGRREHRPGCHDDVLFAGMVANRVHRVCPHVRRTQITVRSARPEDRPDWASAADPMLLPGGVNPFDPNAPGGGIAEEVNYL